MARMKTKGFDLDSLRIASPCHVGWDAMQGDERVRYCDSCQLNVFNVAELTVSEVEQLVLAREGRLCIRMYRRADGTVITKDCPVGLRAYQKRFAKFAGTALTAILGLFSVSFAQRSDGKAIDASKVAIVRTITHSRESELRGVVMDTQGAIVPGAQIVLLTKASILKTKSDAQGQYGFKNLTDGVFAFTVQVPGFEKYEVKN